MFPGWNIPKIGWSTYPEKNKSIQHNFIKELEKLGDIYYYELKFYNIFHYTCVKLDQQK